ncbi:MAG: hypothetical protein FWF42_02105 [Streptococcaceae bacterium]|jgi:uncharacterized membrane protein|nr:hypothetical protein [Streptococcaceae bacterium]MCL2680923.1 hypothetical protein [Streptococcaceae bacterium]MCL2858463.1 hypothetical protein [Streptococcaceae bacterium]
MYRKAKIVVSIIGVIFLVVALIIGFNIGWCNSITYTPWIAYVVTQVIGLYLDWKDR